MEKAICSRVDLTSYTNLFAVEFNDCIGDLIENAEIKKLDNFFQHMNTSRLQHSINVAYHSYLLCKFLHFDYKSAARAGLLHDFYLYDWRKEKQPEGRHASAHPKVALRNSKNLFEVNVVEENAILCHMWPLTIRFPKYKEAIIVSLTDKYCACFEIFCNIGKKILCFISDKKTQKYKAE